MLTVLFEIIGEMLLQMIFELLAEFGLRSVAAPFHKRPNPWFAAVGYTVLGAVAGGLSTLLFPANFVTDQSLRILNLILTPIAVGLSMCLVGAWRAKRGDTILRIDRFAYGYLFALSLAIVRFYLAK